MAECKFVKELPDDYLCMICAKVLNEPHLTDCCGQHFCQACLEQWFKKQQKKICPHCRSESFSHISYIPLKRKINALDVYCPNQKEGCKVITTLRELNTHKNICGFVKVFCTQGCGVSIFRKDLTQHCSEKCSKRKIKCKYCGKVDHFEIIDGKHTMVCDEYPVTCPRGCTQSSGIKRKDLAKHAEICPLEKVQCPFNEAGCDATFLRKDLDAHMETSTQQHLMKMMAAYTKLKVEHIELHSKNRELNEDFKQLSSQVASLTLVEPVKLTDENNTFSFSLTSSKGWISPPFCVLDGYKFCVKHKERRQASLMLLKGEDDDNLIWPMNLRHMLEILLEMPHETLAQTRPASSVNPNRYVPPWMRQAMAQDAVSKQILSFHLSANRKLERVAINKCSKEIASIALPENELLNYKMTVMLVPDVVERPTLLPPKRW